MNVITIRRAKTELSQLVEKAERAETIYIGGRGKPQAKLVSVRDAGRLAPRTLGV